jgi:hypothetical protein
MAWNPSRISGFFLTLAFTAFFVGCQESPKAEKPKPPSERSPAASTTTTAPAAEPESPLAKNGPTEKPNITRIEKEEKPVVKRPKPKTPPPPLTIPKVGLSDALRATCLLNVGDMVPDVELLALDGRKAALENLYGETYTVAFLWSEKKSTYARLAADEALQDLQNDLAGPYAAKGVKVIGINVGDKPAVVGQELQNAGIKIPCYFDPDRAFFSKLATSRLPRVYLLDAAGKIIWFDTEYTQSTRRNLMIAVRVLFGEK